MKKLKLLLGIGILAMAQAAAIRWGSPYAPVVMPCPEDIETIWAIEDSHTQSDVPLVSALQNCGMPVAYDAQKNRFYCTLGTGLGEEWPKIHLTAPEAGGVRLVFTDDYSYDACDDAVRQGNAYEVLAYTDTEYAYFEIVFTGMQQICMTSSGAFGPEDIPVKVSLSTGREALVSDGRSHYRGGVTMQSLKHGYRIEFTKSSDGKRKTAREVPGMGRLENLVLIPMVFDRTMMRDRLNWELYAELVAPQEPFSARSPSYVELFVNGAYEGIYLMIEPYDYEVELAKYGPEHVITDSVYRTGSVRSDKDRPTCQGAYIEGRGYELHYLPAGAEAFAAIEDLIDLCRGEDDERFCSEGLNMLDLDSLLRTELYMQGAGLTDNAFNNLFVWARLENGRYRYVFFPWDMDMSWGAWQEQIGEHYDKWQYFPIADRMINLDAGGIVRSALADMWSEMRQKTLTVENVEEKVMRYGQELYDSGAVRRNAERWDSEDYEVNGYALVEFAAQRLPLIDRVVAYIAGTDDRIQMLEYTDYDVKCGEIFGIGEEPQADD